MSEPNVSFQNFDWACGHSGPAVCQQCAGRWAAENAVMRKHLGALHVYATGKDPGRDLNEFAAQFPRTWNAIVTDQPASFDLPETAPAESSPFSNGEKQ